MNVILEQRFRDKLLQALSANGISKSELARRMGTSPQYMSEYVHGRKSPGLDVLERFAFALHVEPANLIDENPIRLLTTIA